jgi:hypothetical protein
VALVKGNNRNKAAIRKARHLIWAALFNAFEP